MSDLSTEDVRSAVADLIASFPGAFPEFAEDLEAAAKEAEQKEADDAVAESVTRSGGTVDERFQAFLAAKRKATGARDNPGFHRRWLD